MVHEGGSRPGDPSLFAFCPPARGDGYEIRTQYNYTPAPLVFTEYSLTSKRAAYHRCDGRREADTRPVRAFGRADHRGMSLMY